MKKILMLILLTVSTNVFSDDVHKGAWTGNELIQWLNNENAKPFVDGYISGIVETRMFYSSTLDFCFTNGTTSVQIRQIVYNYMIKNPTLWTLNGSFLVGLALKEAYPCKK